MKYRYTGPTRVLPLPLGRWVEPGEVFETDRKITHPHFEIVKAKKEPIDGTDN